MIYVKHIAKVVFLKPHRIIAHIKTRLMYLFPRFFSGRAAYPHTIYIGITKRCNLRCKMCDLGRGIDSSYGRHLSPGTELSFEHWKKFIDEVAEFHPAIELSAAEPLLYNDFMPLVKYIKQKKLVCRLFSNGYLLEKYASFIKDVGVDYLFVSIDGTPEIHDHIRGRQGSFDRAVNGLLKVKQSRDQKPDIDINFTISHYNYSQIEATIRALKGRGVKFNRFTVIQTLFLVKEMAQLHNRLYPDYPANPICEEGVDFNLIDTQVVKEQIDKLKRNYPQEVRFYPDFDLSRLDDWYKKPQTFVSNNNCMFIWNSANITADGSVIPNFRCVNKKLGNITSAEFKDIWNNKTFREFRILSKKHGPFPICARCSAGFVE